MKIEEERREREMQLDFPVCDIETNTSNEDLESTRTNKPILEKSNSQVSLHIEKFEELTRISRDKEKENKLRKKTQEKQEKHSKRAQKEKEKTRSRIKDKEKRKDNQFQQEESENQSQEREQDT